MLATPNVLVEEKLIKHQEKLWLTQNHRKENDNSPETKSEVMENCDLVENSKHLS